MTVPTLRRGPGRALLAFPLLCLPFGGAAAPPEAGKADAAFLAETGAAMAKMHADMNIRPTGDVDADFVAMMIPHHQGAIDMARSVLRYGRNEQVRRIAQGIVVEQQQEIEAMRLAVGQLQPPATSGGPTAVHQHPDSGVVK
jgi:hypothetical protein